MLDKQYNYLGRRIVDEVGQEILYPKNSFVAGRYCMCQADTMGPHRIADGGHHCSALSNQCDNRLVSWRSNSQSHSQRDAIQKIGKAQAIRTQHGDAAGSGYLGKPLLLRPAISTRLGKSRCEYDRSADLSAAAGFKRVERRVARHTKHGGIDLRRQVINRRESGTPKNFGSATADDVNVASVFKVSEASQHGRAK